MSNKIKKAVSIIRPNITLMRNKVKEEVEEKIIIPYENYKPVVWTDLQTGLTVRMDKY